MQIIGVPFLSLSVVGDIQAASLSFVSSILKIIALPFQIGHWLIEGMHGFVAGMANVVVQLPDVSVVLPILLPVLFSLQIGVIALIVRLVRATETERA